MVSRWYMKFHVGASARHIYWHAHTQALFATRLEAMGHDPGFAAVGNGVAEHLCACRAAQAGPSATSWPAIGGDDEEIVSHHMARNHTGKTQSGQHTAESTKQRQPVHAASAPANGAT